MNIIENLIINVTFLLFPFSIYAIYISYVNNFDETEKSIYLDLALFSSVFLMIRYVPSNTSVATLFLINIPLIISYLKNRKFSSVILSIILIIYYNSFLEFPLVFKIVEYSLYFLVYFCLRKKKINNDKFINIFISIKSFVISFELFFKVNPDGNILYNILYLVFILIIFIYITYLIIYLLKKGNNIVELNQLSLQLNKEKKLRTSLFKITHEIKNPIAVCKGYLEMIDYNDKRKLKKYIPIINDEVNRALTIINDFSDYGKIKIEKDIVDLYVLIEDISNILTPLFEKNNVETEFNLDDDDELYIELDYNRIKQVLLNIFKNAIEAKKEDKELKITLNIKKNKNSVNIIIKDNGIGMDKVTLDKVYELFYTTKRNGTGLGVALSNEIIRMHNGSLNYKSKLGVGTEVIIKLPLK